MAPRGGQRTRGGLLAIDISNAHTALALWRGDTARHHWQLSTDPRRTVDEQRVFLSRLLAQAGLLPADVTDCVLGSVVPDLVPILCTTCETLFGVAPLVVGPGIRTGLPIRTEDPREVGPDRIANAVAARDRFGAPVVVLDFATALTVDVVGPGGDYLGAIIAPGPAVAAESLARRTARLPRGELALPPSVIATDTAHGLQSGLFYGYLGLVEGLVHRLWAEVGPSAVIATGEATWLASLLDHTEVVTAYEPLLTLDGLRRIHALQHRGPNVAVVPA